MPTTPPRKLDRITAGDDYECVAALLGAARVSPS